MNYHGEQKQQQQTIFDHNVIFKKQHIFDRSIKSFFQKRHQEDHVRVYLYLSQVTSNMKTK